MSQQFLVLVTDVLSDEALKKFKELYRDEFNEEISDQLALELGVNLLTFFDAIYRPIKKEWLEKLIKKENGP